MEFRGERGTVNVPGGEERERWQKDRRAPERDGEPVCSHQVGFHFIIFIYISPVTLHGLMALSFFFF